MAEECRVQLGAPRKGAREVGVVAGKDDFARIWLWAFDHTEWFWAEFAVAPVDE